MFKGTAQNNSSANDHDMKSDHDTFILKRTWFRKMALEGVEMARYSETYRLNSSAASAHA
jgi:hypothetical protein